MAATTCLFDMTDSILVEFYSVALITMTGYMIIIGMLTMRPITLLSCSLRFTFFLLLCLSWQFVEILQWCHHFLSALPLVYLRKLVSVCTC